MNKPTSGPWKVTLGAAGSPGREIWADKRLVASGCNNRANTLLMAAAPTLLAALEDMIGPPEKPGEECEGPLEHRCTSCRARAAIAKARGL